MSEHDPIHIAYIAPQGVHQLSRENDDARAYPKSKRRTWRERTWRRGPNWTLSEPTLERKGDAWAGETPLSDWHIYASTQYAGACGDAKRVEYIVTDDTGMRLAPDSDWQNSFGVPKAHALRVAMEGGCPEDLLDFIRDPFPKPEGLPVGLRGLESVVDAASVVGQVLTSAKRKLALGFGPGGLADHVVAAAGCVWSGLEEMETVREELSEAESLLSEATDLMDLISRKGEANPAPVTQGVQSAAGLVPKYSPK